MLFISLQDWSQLWGGPSQLNVLKPAAEWNIFHSAAISVPHALWARSRGSSTPNISSWAVVTGRRRRQRHADMQPRDRPTAWHHCGESGTKKEECCQRAGAGRHGGRIRHAAVRTLASHCGSTAEVVECYGGTNTLKFSVFCRDTPRLPVECIKKGKRDGYFVNWSHIERLICHAQINDPQLHHANPRKCLCLRI